MRTFLRGKITLLFMTFGLLLAIPAVALADNIQDNIADDVASSLQLTAGDANSDKTAEIKVIGNNAQQDPDSGCNFDTATESLTIKFNTPTGVTATAVDGATTTPGEMKFTACGVDQTVNLSASSSAVAGDYTVTATIVTNATGGGTFVNQVSIPITVSPPPDSTAPTVTASAVKGDAPDFTGATTYTADTWTNKDVKVTFTCADNAGGSGLTTASGNQVKTYTTETNGTTATFDGTCKDNAGNTAAASSFGLIKIDKTNPTIASSADRMDGTTVLGSYVAGTWTNKSVRVSFSCNDALSGVNTTASDIAGNTLTTEGEDQSVSSTGSCVDQAGNTNSGASFSNIDIDKTNPLVSLVGGPAGGGSYYFGSVPDAPTCTASDALSGLDGVCSVSGYDATVGNHTVTASAKDNAANTASDSHTYDVLAWTTKGFYQPVDMGGVFNTVKGGSTVPLKFELFAGDTELTATTSVKSLTYAKVNCDGSAPTDDIETVATGGTSLRYDSTGGQFIYNWKTPTGQGCYKVTMLAQDGSTISAFFKTK
jgi:hypothetical protein